MGFFGNRDLLLVIQFFQLIIQLLSDIKCIVIEFSGSYVPISFHSIIWSYKTCTEWSAFCDDPQKPIFYSSLTIHFTCDYDITTASDISLWIVLRYYFKENTVNNR